ncbi:MAG: hypothetical protein K0R98_294 [Rickettsiaceae bacterium]|jgi:hypothetical protein|nr:hypothetical protein [Rickettsiaceae bacterium]
MDIFMNTLKNYILVLVAISALMATGCTRPDREQVPPERKFLGISKDQFKPRAYRDQIFDHTPFPDRTPQNEYEQKEYSYESGFQDGCQTATSAIGEGLYRLRGPKIDADRLTTDAMYLRGFQDASTYCTLTLDWETH